LASDIAVLRMVRPVQKRGSCVLGVVVRAAMLVGMFIALLFPRRGRRTPRTSIRLVASSLWSLDHSKSSETLH
jgi:hypothetical protein